MRDLTGGLYNLSTKKERNAGSMCDFTTLKDIPVVIMAGGKGTRLKPFTDVLPKPLLLYKGKTFLEQVISIFENLGAFKFYVLLHSQKDLIKTYLTGFSPYLDITTIDEPQPLGTAGGLKFLEGKIKGTFIVCNCDNIGYFDYITLVNQHMRCGLPLTVLVKQVAHQVPLGIIGGNLDGRINYFLEKPEYLVYASTGIHILNDSIFNDILDNQVLDMPDLIKRQMSKKEAGYILVEDGEWIDMSIMK